MLGPILLLIYISDITDDLFSLLLIYADDATLLKIVFDPAVSAGRLNCDLRWLPIFFLSARADFENLVMTQAFKLQHAKIAREITH